MNKSLLAVALSVSTVGGASSAVALNFTNGAFTGSVDIAGTITIPQVTNQWEWAAGDALSFASIPVSQMSSDYKTLTVVAASNFPLLVGQTKAATIGATGSASLNPQIAFKDAAGTAVIPVWDNTGNSGKGTITLPVTDAEGTTLGSMKLQVQVGGVRAQIYDGLTITALESTSTGSTSTGLYGEVAQPSELAGTFATGSAAAAWNAVLGAHSATDLLSQLNTASGLNFAAWHFDNRSQGYAFSDPGAYFSGTYGLGIAQGDKIIVSFTSPVTANTTWKAPMKMTVTYL